MAMLVLVDDGRGDFGPLTDLRPSFDLCSGALTARQRALRVVADACSALFVPAALAPIVAARTEVPVNHLPPAGPDATWLLIHGRCIDGRVLQQATQLALGQQLVQPDGQAVAAHLDSASAEAWVQRLTTTAAPALHAPLVNVPVTRRVLAERPWHLLADLESNLRFDLDGFDHPLVDRTAPGLGAVGSHAIRVARSAKLHPMVVLNAEKGPIVIDHGAVIGSFAVLGGPCYVGPQSIIAPHTHVRAGTSIGSHCVAGGEISASILAGCTNKAHSGYLGNSYVGHWVNLGAETTVSNLKNTYGTVRMQLSPRRPPEDSGLLKLGPVIGDFVRTAIGSRLLTGSCVGTATMLAVSGFGPKCAPRFRFITDDEDQAYDVDKFLATAAAMTSRRGMSLSDAEVARLRALAAD